MKQNTNRKTRMVVYTLLILFIGVFLAYGFMYKFPKLFHETITKIEKDVTVTDEGIADAVEKVYDSVIVVSNYKNDKLYASGSGFIYKVDGKDTYIITNHHVVADGTSYKVTYTDGSVEDAFLLGGDVYADIAILKVSTKDDVKAVSIGKSEVLRVGDTTFTVGAPKALSVSTRFSTVVQTILPHTLVSIGSLTLISAFSKYSIPGVVRIVSSTGRKSFLKLNT